MPDYSELSSQFGDDFALNVPAAVFTTYKAGGVAEAVVKPASQDELAWALNWCYAKGAPVTVLGQGSNVLVGDAGLPGVTVLTGKLSRMFLSGTQLRAQAGLSWDELTNRMALAGLGGLEKTSGIPGSVGGAVIMNAGAFGQETFDRLVSVTAMDMRGNTAVFLKSDLPHGYRRVEGLADYVVVSAVFEFTEARPDVVMRERDCVLKARAERQPLELPSAGSVFKRPEGNYASRLIDEAGLKGCRVGGAMVSPKHAGFIVNAGGATAADIRALVRKVQAEVKAKTGFALEPEQVFLGKFTEDEAAL
jgi:UDP-N-acetylmuramate dehydrogenase